MDQEGLCRKKYPSDLTDEQWAIVSPMIPPAKQNPRGGRPRKVDMREVLNTSAALDDGVAAPILLAHVTPADFPRLGVIFADQKYHNYVFEAWLAEHRAGWRLDVKMRPEGTKGFTPLAKRWVVERTNAWHGRYRRNSKDYERTVESSTAMIQISNIHLMLNKLVPCSQPAFHYRTEAA